MQGKPNSKYAPNTKTKALQEIWKAAFKREEAISIPHASESDAKKRRFDLYNAVKIIRTQPALDFTLADAIKEVSIWFADDKTTLMIGKRKLDDGLLAVLADLGIDTEAAQDPNLMTPGLEAMLGRIAEKVEDTTEPSAIPTGKNKYY